MLDTKILLVVPVLSLIGSGSYVYAVLKGQARPNRVTWVLWALAPLIAFAAEIHAGIGLQSLLTFMAGFGPLLVVIASYITNKAVWKLTKFDFICGGLSILGLILWLIVRKGDIAIIFSILADGLAAVPTIVKSYRAPETESYWISVSAMSSAVLTLLTLHRWTISNAAFTTYILIVCSILFVLVRFRIGPRLAARRVPQ